MKIAIHSDLHMEFIGLDEDFLEDQDFDVLVLAGDISVQSLLHLDLAYITDRRDKPIIFVAGNHDYYNRSHDEENIRRICDMHGIHFLEEDSITIGDTTFYGATGYTPMVNLDDEKKLRIEASISDFNQTSEWGIHDHCMAGIQNEAFFMNSAKVPGKKVFISHFPPFMELQHPGYPVNLLTHYFNNDYSIDDFEILPVLWISGHIHSNHDVVVKSLKGKSVRCVSNQRGYPGEMQDYSNNFIVEI